MFNSENLKFHFSITIQKLTLKNIFKVIKFLWLGRPKRPTGENSSNSQNFRPVEGKGTLGLFSARKITLEGSFSLSKSVNLTKLLF